MQTILARFPDRTAAEAAAERLVEAGFRREGVHLHQRGRPPRNAAGLEFDEYASGGFFSNFLALLDGLLETPPAPNEAETYADVIREEGVGVSVGVESEGRAEEAERVLQAAGAMKMTRHGGVFDNDA
ncbi:hypothetical protein [Piscinibacter koreensis]|uniref:Uncharacterized protein n=1 Tax=Piscinibacter koreensis TaxID=2742824 RepID=A0A7Y6TUV2_9BURK|nr:hypothetical protein [Schlegelella koreensis]NUZ04266.1 hypothetical protein [Schlegelella koreensis]